MKQMLLLVMLLFMIITACTKSVQLPNTLSSTNIGNAKSLVYSSHDSIVLSDTEYNPCTGENIYVSGKIMYKIKYTYADDSIVRYDVEMNGVGIKAIGLTSGVKYNSTFHLITHTYGIDNGNHYVLRKEKVSSETKYVSPIGILTELEYFHYLLDPDGTLKINRYSYKFECS